MIDENGIKHDEDKLPYYTVLCKQFPNAVRAIIRRSQQGHEKYEEFDQDWQNWDRVPDGYNTYSNALLRHLFNEGEDSELEHDIAVAWNALARLEKRMQNDKKPEQHREDSFRKCRITPE